MDRERDAKVAEALGWTDFSPGYGTGPDSLWGRSPEQVARIRPVPDYSKWENAGPLLEKMLEEGWTFHDGEKDQQKGGMFISLWSPDERVLVLGEGTTLPDAIAECFLKTREPNNAE